jgi:hypothetical protein
MTARAIRYFAARTRAPIRRIVTVLAPESRLRERLAWRAADDQQRLVRQNGSVHPERDTLELGNVGAQCLSAVMQHVPSEGPTGGFVELHAKSHVTSRPPGGDGQAASTGKQVDCRYHLQVSSPLAIGEQI